MEQAAVGGVPVVGQNKNVRAALAALQAAIDEQGVVTAESPAIPFARLWEQYWDAEGQYRKSADSIRCIGAKLNKAFATRPIDTIKERDVAALQNAYKRAGVSNGTINRAVASLKRAFAWGVGNELLEFSAVRDAPMLPETNRRKAKVKTEADLERLLAASSPLVRAMILVAIDGGARQAEIFQLKWKEVHFGDRLIRLTGARTKNGKPRDVPLSARALDAIQRLPRLTEWVFSRPGPRPVPYSKCSLYRMYRATVDSVGLVGAGGERILFHTLRHSFVYRARKAGLSDRVVMRWGGWASRGAYDRYAIVDDDEVESARDLMEAAVAVEREDDTDKKPPR